MPRSEAVDRYVEAAPAYARPILERLRRIVHGACPDAVEALKWGMPHFLHAGSLLCGMAAFKQHVAFGFWRARELGLEKPGGMGHLGSITALRDLPPKAELEDLVRRAAALNEAGPRRKPAPRAARAPVRVPVVLTRALAAVPAARANFAGFPPSARRDYAEWIGSAKTEATRARRLEQAVAWIREGKRRNWRYERPRVAKRP